MVLYHRTQSRAEAILAHGFGDADAITIDERTGRRHLGIWLAECYFDADPNGLPGEVPNGGVLIAVTIPRTRLTKCKCAGPQKPYRVFCVPATIVNRYSIRPVTASDEERLARELDVQLRFGLTPTAARYWIAFWTSPDRRRKIRRPHQLTPRVARSRAERRVRRRSA
jgi:hypothetical protein